MKSILGLIPVIPVVVMLYVGLAMNPAQAQLNSSQQSGAVTFSGQHAGMDFKGKFERWQATLVLPPTANPKITATFYLSSAKTGDSIYDSTLPEFDWFDIENHPQGKFISNNIISDKNGYRVSGELTLKGITQPVSFTLIDSANKLTANFAIDRLAFNIGVESDPEAEWVSKTISLSISISK